MLLDGVNTHTHARTHTHTQRHSRNTLPALFLFLSLSFRFLSSLPLSDFEPSLLCSSLGSHAPAGSCSRQLSRQNLLFGDLSVHRRRRRLLRFVPLGRRSSARRLRNRNRSSIESRDQPRNRPSESSTKCVMVKQLLSCPTQHQFHTACVLQEHNACRETDTRPQYTTKSSREQFCHTAGSLRPNSTGYCELHVNTERNDGFSS